MRAIILIFVAIKIGLNFFVSDNCTDAINKKYSASSQLLKNQKERKMKFTVSDPVTSASGRIYSWKGLVLLQSVIQMVYQMPQTRKPERRTQIGTKKEKTFRRRIG